MKKLASIILALFLLTLFSACGEASQRVSGGEAPVAGDSSSGVDETPEDGQFTSRDKDVGYSDYVTVTLQDGASRADGDGAEVTGDTITLSAEGTYLLKGTLANGQVLVSADDTAKLQIVLDGASISCSDSAAIYVKSADKVFLTTTRGSENTLATTGEFVQTDDNTVDGAIFAKSDLTLNGEGSLTVSSPYGHGIVSKDDLKVTSGTLAVISADHALAGQDSVRVADGALTLTSGQDGIHGGSDDTEGYVYISGGDLTIDAGDDGLHAEAALTLEGGRVTVLSSYEGAEGASIAIKGGELTIKSRDDGLNAASATSNSARMGADGSSIVISGGVINIDAGGDGIDSNGDLTVTGGETYISGPTDSGNGALDFAGTGTITGGVVVAAGSPGMAQNFGNASTQGSMLVSFAETHPAGDEITLRDPTGAVLARYSPAKSYGCVVISAPEIAASGTYTVSAGSEESEITMTSLIYGSSGMGGFGGHAGQQDRPQRPDNATRPNSQTPPDATTQATPQV